MAGLEATQFGDGSSIDEMEKTTFSGRRLTRKQLAQVQETVRTFSNLSRQELALTVCEHLSWVSPNGKNKVKSSLTLLEELERRGVVTMPPKREQQKPARVAATIEGAAFESEIETSLESLGPIELERVTTKEDRALFRDYLRKYHYLGYRTPLGPQVAYFLVSKRLGRRLGCLLFSASAAPSLAARDEWIGWQPKHRAKLLHLIVNNNRFLIFPWVKVAHLATRALSLCTCALPKDWLELYSYRPVLVETFVDTTKYAGTCYRAANWQHVGQTKGRGRHDVHHENKETIKDIYMHPLAPTFRAQLTGEVSATSLHKKYRNDLAASRTRTVDDGFVSLWKGVIQIVSEVASEYDEKWQVRKRLTNSLLVMLFIFRLVSSKNSQSYGATIDELWDSCKALNLPLPQKGALAASSLCEARKKLDEEAFQTVNERILQAYKPTLDANYRWRGHRLFAVDGTKMNLPRALLAASHSGYTLPSQQSHYPQGLVSCLYQLKSQIPFDFDLFHHANERTAAEQHLRALQKDDVVVYDRGYFSYRILYVHHHAGIHAIFRLPESSFCVVQNFFSSNKTDDIVTLEPSSALRSELRAEHPEMMTVPIALRLVKYCIGSTTFVLGTTLLDARYTRQELQDIYHERWGIEELYKVSKRVLDVEDFHAKTERGVKQELFAHFVLITMNRIFAHNAGNSLRLSSTASCPSTRSPSLQINFKSCIHVFTRHIEALLLIHQNAKTVVQHVCEQIAGRYHAMRSGRAFKRLSLRPDPRWRPSSTKKKLPSTALAPT